ncbi:putative uncharacterized protein [Prevotella sp. CAG:487]|nr:putative uncharacterized protein [Prevotella sp. CAG:487]
MTRRFLIILSVFTAVRVAAQSGAVVADMSSRKPLMSSPNPLRAALVVTDGGEKVATDYRGRFALSGSYRGASVICKGYLRRNMTADEMRRDTIFLIPEVKTLSGVEIVLPGDGLGALKKSLGQESKAVPVKPKSGNSFDFFGIFDKSKRRVSKKERERQKRILDNY